MHLIAPRCAGSNTKDRRRVAAQLGLIYGAPTENAAKDALDALADSDPGREYPGIVRRWRQSWELVTPFFDFAPGVRKVIYTTNTIESIHSGPMQTPAVNPSSPQDHAPAETGRRERGRSSTATGCHPAPAEAPQRAVLALSAGPGVVNESPGHIDPGWEAGQAIAAVIV